MNWEQAANSEVEDGENYAMTRALEADVQVCAEVGFLSEMTGGPDALTELVTEALRLKAEGAHPEDFD